MKIDVFYRNGRIRTMDPANPIARSIAVLGGRVVALDDDAQSLDPVMEIDLAGQPVLPGFNDVHHHLTVRGQRLRGVDLRHAAVPSLGELYVAIKQAAADAEPGSWIYGSGYDQNKIGEHPTAQALDDAAPRNPVWLEHVSGHMGVANSAAFELAGFPGRASLPDIDGGNIPSTAGIADGLVQERAMDIIFAVSKPIPVEEIIANIDIASRTALSEGITSITEPGIGTIQGIGNSPLDLHAYLTARERGVLGVRAQVMPYITTVAEVLAGHEDHGYALSLGARTGLGDDWVKIGPLKVLTDGSLIGRSAAMTCCYHEDTTSGFMAWEAAELEPILRGAQAAGFRLAAHAIGDLAVEQVLDIYERLQRDLPRPDARHRIEHLSVVSDAQIARVAALGVIPVPQGRFISELGDGVIRAMGPDRLPLAYRFKSLLDAGIEVPGSSDTPVVDGSPILGIHDLVNRRTAGGIPFVPEESISAAQAVHAYTVGSAYASCEEKDKGMIAPGMLADFVVLSDDLLQVAADRINTVEVTMTVVDGKVAYTA